MGKETLLTLIGSLYIYRFEMKPT